MFLVRPEHCNVEGTLSEYSGNIAYRLGRALRHERVKVMNFTFYILLDAQVFMDLFVLYVLFVFHRDAILKRDQFK